ncbi:MAG TPA: ABC-2 family transporter protein [Ktedonobacterales bacterium]
MPRFYFEVARAAFRRQMIYRWANVSGLVTNIFFGAIISAVFIAVFQSRHLAAGYTIRDTLRYWWMAQSLVMVILPFGWFDLMLTIRTGEVASDLSKPCDFYWYWFSREAGRDVYFLLFRAVPTYLAGMLLFGIGVPGGPVDWIAYVPSLAIGAASGIAFRVLYNLVAFWILEARAVGGIAQVLAHFFTGLYVPIAFFPPLLAAVSAWLPFNALENVPVEVVLGKVSGANLAMELARQALWLVALTLAARGLAAVAARRVIVQGG